MSVDDLAAIEQWFASRRWTPFDYQRRAWRTFLEGRSGLINAPTGMGKTFAAALGPMAEALGRPPHRAEPGCKMIWVTPLRALAADIAASLRQPLGDLDLPWNVGIRTGDTSSSVRRRQKQSPPDVLVTTPESLTILLSYADTYRRMASLQCVVVDEWHELLSTKRGTQTELALARLRTIAPGLRTWGLSATLPNLKEAARALVGTTCDNPGPTIIQTDLTKTIDIRTLIPDNVSRFARAGHIGLSMVHQVVQAIDAASTTLLFTSTRSQTEAWYRALLDRRPEWEGTLGIHHGSVERTVREQTESGLHTGKLRCVVCTSSLDLGVDFRPVEQIIQVGSPKGVNRLIQRAGRSGHAPGQTSRIICVPTNSFELIEFAAARDALHENHIEARQPLCKPLDVLLQHIVTAALAGGFREAELLREIRNTWAYRDLSDEEWQWAMEFVSRGGHALRAYPQYHRIRKQDDRWVVSSRRIAQFHRMSIGTIAADSHVSVCYLNGTRLGTVEEAFVARLRPGDAFSFAGRPLKLVQVRDMKAFVRRAKNVSGHVPVWLGGRMPLSTQLAKAVLARFAEAPYDCPEMEAAKPIIQLQKDWSRCPSPDTLLVEHTQTRDGDHWFVYPFEGRRVHQGMAALAAWRLTQRQPCSVTMVVNDYGFELTTPRRIDLNESDWRDLLDPLGVEQDIADSLNDAELARREFRGIARVSGLVFQGYPGSRKSARQVQASSGLIHDVFAKYDPENLLLAQARQAVLNNQLEFGRLRTALKQCHAVPLSIVHTHRLTPLAFPLWTDRVRAQVSTEDWSERVQRMMAALERAAP